MTNVPQQKPKAAVINDAIIKDIAGAVVGLKFGEIMIKVHDSKIIQMEKTEKVRYDAYHLMQQGGGI